MMNEFTCHFGDHKRLSGIAIQSAKPQGQKPVVIFVNAGFIPSHGPFRLYALLARKLNENGISSLRFDLGGIGFSEECDPSLPLLERTQKDMKAAVDYAICKMQATQVILCGLCSGAEDSFRYAETDDRVNAIAMIDPHCYATKGYWRRKRWSLDIPKRVIIKLERILNSWLSRNKLEGYQSNQQPDLIEYEYMSYQESKNILRKLHQRGVKLHYIYTGGMRGKFNHPKQFYEMYPDMTRDEAISITHLPWLEHTQFLKEDITTLIDQLNERIVSWSC